MSVAAQMEPGNGVGIAGQIKSIHAEHFMSHQNFEIELGCASACEYLFVDSLLQRHLPGKEQGPTEDFATMRTFSPEPPSTLLQRIMAKTQTSPIPHVSFTPGQLPHHQPISQGSGSTS